MLHKVWRDQAQTHQLRLAVANKEANTGTNMEANMVTNLESALLAEANTEAMLESNKVEACATVRTSKLVILDSTNLDSIRVEG